MPGRRIVTREDLAKRLDIVAELYAQVEPPEHLADLVWNTFWNVSAIPDYLISNEQALEDVLEALKLVDLDLQHEVVQRAIFTALIPEISKREHATGLMYGSDGKILQS